MKLSVLGAGNGGQALAGHLALLGNDVVLFEHPDYSENLEAIRERGNQIRLEGVISGTGKLRSVTSDISEVMEYADILFMVMPSYAQERILDLAIPFLRHGQLVVLLPGNFASLVAKRKLHDVFSTDRGVMIAETDTIPYACRLKAPGEVTVWGVKSYLSISCLPASALEKTLVTLEPAFPIPMNPMKNVLNVGFANTNMILHCPTMIMNTGRIESDTKGFRFYSEGMTPSVCKVMEGMDSERIRVGEKYDLNLISEYEDALANYPSEGDFSSLYEVLQNSKVYGGHGPDSPKTMSFRYLSEDVPYLLVPVSQFGLLGGIPTPLIDAVIVLSETVNGVKYRETGRTLDSMGLGGVSVKEILDSIQ